MEDQFADSSKHAIIASTIWGSSSDLINEITNGSSFAEKHYIFLTSPASVGRQQCRPCLASTCFRTATSVPRLLASSGPKDLPSQVSQHVEQPIIKQLKTGSLLTTNVKHGLHGSLNILTRALSSHGISTFFSHRLEHQPLEPSCFSVRH